MRARRRTPYRYPRDVPCRLCGATTTLRDWRGTYSECRRAYGCKARDDRAAGFEAARRAGRTVQYLVGGVWRSIADLAREHDTTAFVVYDRLRRGWGIADAVLEPPEPRKGRIALCFDVGDGELVPAALLLAGSRRKRSTVRYKLLRGCALHEALGYDPRPELQRFREKRMG